MNRGFARKCRCRHGHAVDGRLRCPAFRGCWTRCLIRSCFLRCSSPVCSGHSCHFRSGCPGCVDPGCFDWTFDSGCLNHSPAVGLDWMNPEYPFSCRVPSVNSFMRRSRLSGNPSSPITLVASPKPRSPLGLHFECSSRTKSRIGEREAPKRFLQILQSLMVFREKPLGFEHQRVTGLSRQVSDFPRLGHSGRTSSNERLALICGLEAFTSLTGCRVSLIWRQSCNDGSLKTSR